MKTLILNGSPKRNGDTAAFVNALKERLDAREKAATILSMDTNNLPAAQDQEALRQIEAAARLFNEPTTAPQA